MSDAWRIVVADDHPDAADCLGWVLGTCGCIPHIARDGPTALAVIRQYQPHAALLELTLPQMAGWDVARAVRHPRTTHMVMITVTAWSRNSATHSQGPKETHGREETDAADLAEDGDLPQVVAGSGRTYR